MGSFPSTSQAAERLKNSKVFLALTDELPSLPNRRWSRSHLTSCSVTLGRDGTDDARDVLVAE